MQQAKARQEEELINRLADWIAQRGLITPAMFLLEINKPFTFLGSQMLRMFQPLLGPATGDEQIEAYARLLEDRANIEGLLARLESCRVQDPTLADDTRR
jgi:hypothetical protein